LCKHHLNEFIAIAQSHATTMGHIKRNDLDTAMVLVPSLDELKKMSETMEPIFSKLKNNNYQLVSLRTQRDILLPKLMSNEISIK
jgi:type I restriction enzyme S subunit